MRTDGRASDALVAAYALLLCRFSPREAERLVALKMRAERGEFRELTDADRLACARWLVAHRRLTEWPPVRVPRPV
jgi:hypothetical protein